MIKTKAELNEFLREDKKALGKNYNRPHCFSDEIWKFEICLRKHEYYLNTGNHLMSLFYHFRHHKLGLKLGFTIPCNVFDEGLCIHHWGYVVVNEKAKVGRNCQIFQGVNIGEDPGGGTPQIGNNSYLGPGAKLFGDIHIGNNVSVGANAVVNHSFEDNVVIAGVPAKIVRRK